MSTEKQIWDFLKSKGFNNYACAGIMGNLFAESGLNPSNLQDTYNTLLHMTDAEYVANVDSSKYKNFVNDNAGFGIAQWTYSTRKQNLLNYARSKNASIGNLEIQLNFLYSEISSDTSLMNDLTKAKSILSASNAVLTKYEKPLKATLSVRAKRAEYAKSYYSKYAKTDQKEKTNMGFTNSHLATYTQLSPNNSGKRNHAIDTITIHCFVGQFSIERMGQTFASASYKASSNYGIAYDGEIGLFVEEQNRSWCTSSSSNDNRAITIEVASDTSDPYKVTDAAYKSLIKLLVDICQRNGIKQLLWKGDKSLIGQVSKQNMTVHRWFAAKDCPGQYLYDLHPKIAAEVNEKLGVKSSSTVSIITTKFTPYKVQVTVDVLNVRASADISSSIKATIRDKGTYTIVEELNGWGKLKSGAGWIKLDYTKKI